MNELAKIIVNVSTEEVEKMPESAKAKSGPLGGLKGGQSLTEKLAAEDRSAKATKSGQAL